MSTDDNAGISVTSREGRVSRNRPRRETVALRPVTSREGRVSRNGEVMMDAGKASASRPARDV